MRVIYGGRQTGRTTTLIELAAEAEAKGEISYIVCHSQDEAWRIAQKAKEKGLNIGFPITYDEFLHGEYAGQNIKKFFIDNADRLIRRLTMVPIAAMVIEKPENELGA